MYKTLNKNHSFLLNLIYITFVFSLVYTIGLGIKLDLNILMQFFLVIIGAGLTKFFIINPLFLYGTLAVSFISAFLIDRYISSFLFIFIEKAYVLFNNIINNLQGKENINPDNIFLSWMIILFFVSIFTSFILFSNKNIFLLLPVYIVSFIYYWYVFIDQAYFMLSIFLLGFFTLIGIEKSPSNNISRQWLKTVFSYSFLILAISLLLPKPTNYMECPSLYYKVYSRFPMIEDLRNYNTTNRGNEKASLFNFSITGFQNEPFKLGGPVILSDKKVMTLYANSPNYLRGNVKHIYTGELWESIDLEWSNYALQEDFSNITNEEKELYYEEEDIQITNHSFASTTLFSPYQPTIASLVSNYNLKVSPDNVLTFPQGVYNKESYIIRVQKPLPYGKLLQLGMNKKKSSLENLDIYLQIPDEKITERTKKLVKEIVKDSNNDFEKAVAIESYLRNNYKYNLNVSEVPENQEFIDYFLFEEKEGYCTYYATTMALMLRLEGIPSRYVEGYLAHELKEEGIYEVKQENAHAWVEGFVEPVGWMTLEATPAYSVEDRALEYEENILEEDTIEDIISDIYINPNNKEEEKMEMDEGIIGGNIDLSVEKESDTKSVPLGKDIIMIIIGVVMLIIPLRFLIGFFKDKIKASKFNKLSNKKKIIYLYKSILNIMELLGYPQNSGETHFDYANRVSYKFFNFNENGIQQITEIFVKSKYSNVPTPDEDVMELKLYKDSLEKRLKIQFGIKNYYYRKYVRNEF